MTLHLQIICHSYNGWELDCQILCMNPFKILPEHALNKHFESVYSLESCHASVAWLQLPRALHILTTLWTFIVPAYYSFLIIFVMLTRNSSVTAIMSACICHTIVLTRQPDIIWLNAHFPTLVPYSYGHFVESQFASSIVDTLIETKTPSATYH